MIIIKAIGRHLQQRKLYGPLMKWGDKKENSLVCNYCQAVETNCKGRTDRNLINRFKILIA